MRARLRRTSAPYSKLEIHVQGLRGGYLNDNGKVRYRKDFFETPGTLLPLTIIIDYQHYLAIGSSSQGNLSGSITQC
jgi:hypothetical protein